MPPGLFHFEEVGTPRSPRCIGPYPGFDVTGTCTPESPPCRVKPEGEAFASRNRGSIQDWAFNSDEVFDSPRPDPKCPTSASRHNYQHGRNGTIQPLLNGSATPRPESAPPRIKHEAEGIANVSRGRRMCALLTKYGESGATPRVPRIKVEAEDTATLHKGGRMDRLIHSYGKMTVSARAVPRVKPEAGAIAEVSKGKRMHNLFTKYGTQPLSDRAAPRVKSEATDNADLDKGKRMDRLIHSYERQPLSARAVPRVKSEGEANATLDQGRRMDRLVHSCSSLPKSPRMPPRVKKVEATNTYRRGQGSMGKILNNIGSNTCIYVPGVKKKSYLKTQMM